MPVDANIALGVKPIDFTGTLGSLLNIANSAQQLRSGQIANESNAAILAERNALRSLAQDPSVQDGQGNVDPIKFAIRAPQVAPTQWPPVAQSMVASQTAGITNKKAQWDLDASQADRAFGEMAGVSNDPRVSNLAKFKPGDAIPTQAMDDAGEAIAESVDRMAQSGMPRSKAQAAAAPLYLALSQNPARVPDMLKSIVTAGAGRGQQPTVLGNNYTAVQGQGGTQFYQGNAFAPGGSNVPSTVAPPNQITATESGAALANPATGEVKPLQSKPAGGMPAPTVALPPGETAATRNELQAQRTEVQGQLRTLPERQEVLRNIIDLTDKGTLSGNLGSIVRKINGFLPASAQLQEGTDATALGKYLEQEAARAAQAMGPHTNAGLESAKLQSGTASYDDKSLGKIARLARANASAVPLYDSGLNAAIAQRAQQQPGVEPVFVKRDYDRAWADAYDPRAMRLIVAAKNGDTGDIVDVFKSVGVNGSVKNGQFVPETPMTRAATTLQMKLQRLSELSQGKL